MQQNDLGRAGGKQVVSSVRRPSQPPPEEEEVRANGGRGSREEQRHGTARRLEQPMRFSARAPRPARATDECGCSRRRRPTAGTQATERVGLTSRRAFVQQPSSSNRSKRAAALGISFYRGRQRQKEGGKELALGGRQRLRPLLVLRQVERQGL